MTPLTEEAIPDADSLYMRVHRTAFAPSGTVRPEAFRDRDDTGMSTDWSRYATPEETRSRAKVASENGVIAMNAGKVRRIAGLTVRHSPLPDNRAHADVRGVYGADKVRVRAELLLIASVVLPLASP